MIYKQSNLKIVDNSGAKVIRVFRLCKYCVSEKYSQSGDLILGSVIKYKAKKKVSKKQICKALVITTKKNIFRENGLGVRFDENRGVLLENSKLVGTRIFGPLSREILLKNYNRLVFSSKQLI